LTITFLLLGVAEMTGKHGVAVAGGAFGIVRSASLVVFVLTPRH
jgi:succinate-acetate transporter protein